MYSPVASGSDRSLHQLRLFEKVPDSRAFRALPRMQGRTSRLSRGAILALGLVTLAERGIAQGDADGQKLTPPVLVERVQGSYPDEAKELGVEADVELLLIIDASGRVTQISVERVSIRGGAEPVTDAAGDRLGVANSESLARSFAQEAERGAAKFIFAPARRGQTAIAGRIRYLYEFRLPREESNEAIEPTISPPVASETALSVIRSPDRSPEKTTEEPPVHEVDVQGKSVAQRMEESAEAVKVVEMTDARKESADMGEVLARTPGVSVQRTGGLGKGSRIRPDGTVITSWARRNYDDEESLEGTVAGVLVFNEDGTEIVDRDEWDVPDKRWITFSNDGMTKDGTVYAGPSQACDAEGECGPVLVNRVLPGEAGYDREWEKDLSELTGLDSDWRGSDRCFHVHGDKIYFVMEEIPDLNTWEVTGTKWFVADDELSEVEEIPANGFAGTAGEYIIPVDGRMFVPDWTGIWDADFEGDTQFYEITEDGLEPVFTIAGGGLVYNIVRVR